MEMKSIVIAAAMNKFNELRTREEGVALTEYVVLLALLVGGVILAVTAFGDALGDTWDQWAGWMTLQEASVSGLTNGTITTGNTPD
jgi:pilus assembly protein Flp/PilA